MKQYVQWKQFAGIDKNGNNVYVEIVANSRFICDMMELREVSREELAVTGASEEQIERYVDAKIKCNYL